jgi:glycosyltransferase involved in cell wall biosynthesis
MRLLFTVQRYGREVLGGAEELCRMLATRLAARGHHVEVLTSCATGYLDWANQYASGVEEIDGVRVHRMEVARPRDLRLFDALQGRVVVPRLQMPPPLLQREWMRLQGPWIPGLGDEVARLSGDVDATVCFTYLYYTTWAALPAARSATVLHATVHDEPPLRLPLFDLLFRMADGYAFSTPEEAELVRRRFRVQRPAAVVGVGIDPPRGSDVAAFRALHGLGDDPYVVCVGRTEPGKGAQELADFFAAYKRRHPGRLRLVMVGEEVHPVPRHPDVVMAGFVDDATRDAAVAGAQALLQPSYFESFSMSLVQAWAAGIPALVQGHSEVLRGQCRRSGAGLLYRGYAEFEAGLELLLADESRRRGLGESGRAHVSERYSWDAVTSAYEEFLASMPGRRGQASLRGRTAPSGR